MTDMPSTALTIASRSPRRSRLLAAIILLMVLLLGLLAGLCSYRWLIVLPQVKINQLIAQQTQIDALGERLQRLENAPVAAAQTPKGAASTDDLTRLEAEVTSLSGTQATLQGELKRLNDEQTVNSARLAETVTYIRLDTTAKAGQSFAPQLAALRAAAVAQPEIETILSALDPYAASGAPTMLTLQQDWALLAPHIAHASDAANAQTWLDRIKAELKTLISIHSVNDRQPDEIAAVSNALAQGDAGAALTALQKLPAVAQTTADSFAKRLAARQAVDQALDSLSTSLTAPTTATAAP